MISNKIYTNITFKRDFHTKAVYAYCYYWKDKKRLVEVEEITQRYFFMDEDIKLDKDSFIEEHGYEAINGNKVKKVDPLESFNPEQYREFNNMYEGKIYESDVRAIDRWIWDSKPTFDSNIRKWYIDIETLRDKNGQYCTVQEATNKICMITVYDSFCNKVFTFALSDKQEDIKKDNTSIYKFDNETDMLNRLLVAVEQLQPDIFTGWNADKFDMPYIVKRMENLGVDYRRFSPIYSVKLSVKSYKNSVDSRVSIKGRGILDLMEISRQFWMGTDVGYSLDAISKKFLGRGKIEIGNIDKAYYNDFDKLIDYNILDVMLCVDLDKKEGMIEKMQAFQNVMSINLEETVVASKLTYAYIKQHTNIVLTNSYEKEIFDLPGGFVFPTAKGIFKDTSKFDFASHYPSFIRSNNISPETVTDIKPTDPENYIHFLCYYKKADKSKGAKVVLNPSIAEMKKLWKFEVWVSKKKKGKLTHIVDILTETRLNYKHEGNKSLATVFKRLINSIYGLLGYKYSRIFCKLGAMFITLGCQYYTKRHIEYIEKNGIGETLLGDTDSFLCKLNKGFTNEDVLKGSEIVLDRITKEHNLDEMHTLLELEAEVDKLIIFGIKKKYAQLINGKSKIIGLELIRKDFPEALKEYQRRVIKKIFDDDNVKLSDIMNIKEDIKDKIRDSIKSGNHFYYSFPTVIRKPIEEYVGNTAEKKAIKNSGLKIAMSEKFYILECMGIDKNLAFKEKEELDNFKYIVNYDIVISKVFKNCKIFEELFVKQKTLTEYAA